MIGVSAGGGAGTARVANRIMIADVDEMVANHIQRAAGARSATNVDGVVPKRVMLDDIVEVVIREAQSDPIMVATTATGIHDISSRVEVATGEVDYPSVQGATAAYAMSEYGIGGVMGHNVGFGAAVGIGFKPVLFVKLRTITQKGYITAGTHLHPGVVVDTDVFKVEVTVLAADMAHNHVLGDIGLPEVRGPSGVRNC